MQIAFSQLSIPYNLERGRDAASIGSDGDTTTVESSVVGSSPNDQYSPADSRMLVNATLPAAGPSDIYVTDQDSERGLRASVTRNEAGDGVLTISNPSSSGFESRLSLPLGPLVEGFETTFAQACDKEGTIESVRVGRGYGDLSAVVLNHKGYVFMGGGTLAFMSVVNSDEMLDLQ